MPNEVECGEWRDTIAELALAGGLVLVTGAPDTGKTTFCRALALAAIEAGKRTAIVDADVGQSEIGPPACVSVAMPDAPFEQLSSLQPCATAFVGTISPRYATIEHLAAVCRMVGEARARGAEIVICDTTGYVRGLSAQRLKRAKVQALRPERLVRLVRRPSNPSSDRAATADRPDAPESEAVATRPRVHTLRASDAVLPKSPSMRVGRREARFKRALEGSVVREWTIEDIGTEGTWIGAGTPLMPHACAQLSRALRTAVTYAELGAGHLGLVCRTLPGRDAALVAAREMYGALDLSLTAETSLEGLLVGLHDGQGEFLGLGRLTRLDPASRILRVATPSHSYTITRSIHFGLVRLDRTGRALATLRPGDV